MWYLRLISHQKDWGTGEKKHPNVVTFKPCNPSNTWHLRMLNGVSEINKGNKNQLVVEPTHLKNSTQIGNLPQVGMKMKNISNHHLEKETSKKFIYSIVEVECQRFPRKLT